MITQTIILILALVSQSLTETEENRKKRRIASAMINVISAIAKKHLTNGLNQRGAAYPLNF